MFLAYNAMSCSYLFTYKMEYDVIIQNVEMLNATLVYNVSLHMYMYCVMELKSSSCGYQLIYSVAH